MDWGRSIHVPAQWFNCWSSCYTALFLHSTSATNAVLVHRALNHCWAYLHVLGSSIAATTDRLQGQQFFIFSPPPFFSEIQAVVYIHCVQSKDKIKSLQVCEKHIECVLYEMANMTQSVQIFAKENFELRGWTLGIREILIKLFFHLHHVTSRETNIESFILRVGKICEHSKTAIFPSLLVMFLFTQTHQSYGRILLDSYSSSKGFSVAGLVVNNSENSFTQNLGRFAVPTWKFLCSNDLAQCSKDWTAKLRWEGVAGIEF